MNEDYLELAYSNTNNYPVLSSINYNTTNDFEDYKYIAVDRIQISTNNLGYFIWDNDYSFTLNGVTTNLTFVDQFGDGQIHSIQQVLNSFTTAGLTMTYNPTTSLFTLSNPGQTLIFNEQLYQLFTTFNYTVISQGNYQLNFLGQTSITTESTPLNNWIDWKNIVVTTSGIPIKASRVNFNNAQNAFTDVITNEYDQLLLSIIFPNNSGSPQEISLIEYIPYNRRWIKINGKINNLIQFNFFVQDNLGRKIPLYLEPTGFASILLIFKK